MVPTSTEKAGEHFPVREKSDNLNTLERLGNCEHWKSQSIFNKLFHKSSGILDNF